MAFECGGEGHFLIVRGTPYRRDYFGLEQCNCHSTSYMIEVSSYTSCHPFIHYHQYGLESLRFKTANLAIHCQVQSCFGHDGHITVLRHVNNRSATEHLTTNGGFPKPSRLQTTTSACPCHNRARRPCKLFGNFGVIGPGPAGGENAG